MLRPSRIAVTRVPKLSSVEDQVSGLLGHLAPGPHRHADVRLLERGGVVHGVAGHGDDGAALLHEPGQPQLVLRCHPPEDVESRQGRCSSASDIAWISRAADRPGAQLEFGADCGGGDRMVAGDHPHFDARLVRCAHRRQPPPAAAGR